MRSLSKKNRTEHLRPFEDWFEDMWQAPMIRFPFFEEQENVSFVPVDVYEDGNHLVIKAAIPGIKPEELEVEIQHDNILIIKGETKSETEQKDKKFYRRECNYGSYYRSIQLPNDLQLDKIDAQTENGVVTIMIPKSTETKTKSLKVPIKTKSSLSTGKT